MLLSVENLKTYFRTSRGIVKAVDGVSFTLEEGQTRAIVGESGCGKSITSLSILQLIPEPAGYVDSGHIRFNGKDLLDYTWTEMSKIRGKDISMIFQEPMTSLNPTFTVANQLYETMQIHGKTVEEAHKRAMELLERVKIPSPAQVLRQYPHELSGGMRQRVMIAMALMNKPKLLIADEPTTALDVTIQAEILSLMRELQKEYGMAILLITHDLGIVAEIADRVSVMYAGQVVEEASARDLYKHPQHPYTQGLFASLPSRNKRGEDLFALEGIVPDAASWPLGCRFADRCVKKIEGTCEKIAPPVFDGVRCHLLDPNVK
jgi:oligopeptide/dipeptide ABC transporter ATP-binding protein